MSTPAEIRYSALMAFDPGEKRDPSEILQLLGDGIDASLDLRREAGCQHASGLIDRLLSRKSFHQHQSRLHFFQGNCWTNIRAMSGRPREGLKKWVGEETENAIRCYRKALVDLGFTQVQTPLKCQVLTNLAVELRHLGRCIEAIRYYDHAIALSPRFGMATGGKGAALCDYARALTDLHDQIPLWFEARESLAKSQSETDYVVESATEFASILGSLHQWHDRGLLDIAKHNVHKPLFKTEEQRHYAHWNRIHRLQLSPLTDLGLMAEDTLHLSSVSSRHMRSPALFGLLNQLKQEYASARYSLYDGLSSKGPHWADTSVLLVDTLDHPCYGSAIEKVKISFRVAYSLLDKIAFFINQYWQLAIPARNVSFGRCWFTGTKETKGIHNTLLSSENFSLLALYWLSRDIFEGERANREPLDPWAWEHYDLRRHLEHRYVKVHTDSFDSNTEGENPQHTLTDHLSLSVKRSTLEERAIDMMFLVRSALTYLLMAVNTEESKGRQKGVPKVSLPVYPDDRKV